MGNEKLQQGSESGAGSAMERICPGCYLPLPKDFKHPWHRLKCYSMIQKRGAEALRANPTATFEQVVEYAGPLSKKDYARLSKINQSGKGIAGLKAQKEPVAKVTVEEAGEPQPRIELRDVIPEEPSFVRKVAHAFLSFALSRLLPEYIKARERRLLEREGDLAREWNQVRFLEAEVRRAEVDLQAIERSQVARIKVLRAEAEQEIDLQRRDLAGRVKAFHTEMETYRGILDSYDNYKKQAESVPGLLAENERLKKEGETAVLREKDLEAELQTERSRIENFIRERATRPGAPL